MHYFAREFVYQFTVDFSEIIVFAFSTIKVERCFALCESGTNDLNTHQSISDVCLAIERASPQNLERITTPTTVVFTNKSVHINRIEQLFGVVIIAYTWAYLVGIAANLKVKAIRILNNGRHAISLVKYGLNFIADTLLNPFRPTKINVFDYLSCA